MHNMQLKVRLAGNARTARPSSSRLSCCHRQVRLTISRAFSRVYLKQQPPRSDNPASIPSNSLSYLHAYSINGPCDMSLVNIMCKVCENFVQIIGQRRLNCHQLACDRMRERYLAAVKEHALQLGSATGLRIRLG